MIGIIATYCIVVSLSLQGNSSFFVYDADSRTGKAFEGAKWSVLIGFPAVVCTVCGQFGWCPWRRAHVLPLATLVSAFKHRLYWRIVTRGSNPSLVKENAIEAIKVLMGCLPQSLFVVEVVTDNSIDVRSYLLQQGLREDLVEQCFSEVIFSHETSSIISTQRLSSHVHETLTTHRYIALLTLLALRVQSTRLARYTMRLFTQMPEKKIGSCI